MKHLISMKDWTRESIEGFLARVGERGSLEGKIIASCFFEPSTRTRLSFEAAALRLGASVIGFSDRLSTSETKGETLSDSIRVISSYADLIILRHPKRGSALEASQVSSCPIINAGDGDGEHPTQTLIDLYTILQCQCRLDNLNIVICGDVLHGRAVHSLILALNQFNAKLFFVAPLHLRLPYQEHHRLEDVIEEADILYMTRQQKERTDKSSDYLHINLKTIRKVKPNLRILHPLPRAGEIAEEIDETPYAYYFEQAKNGLIVRETILEELCLSPCPL